MPSPPSPSSGWTASEPCYNSACFASATFKLEGESVRDVIVHWVSTAACWEPSVFFESIFLASRCAIKCGCLSEFLLDSLYHLANFFLAVVMQLLKPDETGSGCFGFHSFQTMSGRQSWPSRRAETRLAKSRSYCAAHRLLSASTHRGLLASPVCLAAVAAHWSADVMI
jgi:hypothetical protein